MIRRFATIAVAVAVATIALGSGPAGAALPGTTTPSSKAGGFSANVDNPLFPLKPGTTLVYEGTKDGKHAKNDFFTTHEVQKIDGVPTRVVLDRLYLDGALAETTRDYYTQDSKGNVWYYGEDTAQLDPQGNMLGTEGTWHAGEFGAIPGIFMPGNPKLGETHRQEFLPGHAEDHFQVLDLSAKVTVPYGTFDRALLTKEWTPLEPDVLDHKYFVRGIGMVKEIAVKGPTEMLELVDITHR